MRPPRAQSSLLVKMVSVLTMLGCVDQPDAPCLVGTSDSSAYLVQLRPSAPFPDQCPQGTQYQVIYAHQYTPYGSTDPGTIVFQLAGSQVNPSSDAEAAGQFSSFHVAPPSNVCTIAEMTPALDDSVTPPNAPPTSATYRLSDVRVLSDAAHRGNQFEAAAVVDYGLPGCTDLHYTAQAVFPISTCIDDSICLPDAVATDLPSPGGRGLGSGLSADYRAFCNRDPALLDNSELTMSMAALFQYPFTRHGEPPVPPGKEAYTDPRGNKHDVGVCFLADPFPSLCPPGSTLSKSGPCVVGPGSNPH